MTDLEKLRGFANDILENFQEGDLDGGDRQEMAIRWELLEPKLMPGPCSEACSCADCDVEFPALCYRKTALLKPEVPHADAR